MNNSRISLIVYGVGIFILLTPGVAYSQEPVDQTVMIVSDSWNSLEVVKLIVSLLIPVALLSIGIWMDRRIKEFEHRQWSNQKVIEKRLEVYEKLAPDINEMMCYFTRIGSWKEHNPVEIVDMKRDLDKIAHVYAPLFSPEFLTKYNAFMSNCFAMFRGEGKDAQLRIACDIYRNAYVGDNYDGSQWQDGWDEYFTGEEEATNRNEVRAAYQELLTVTASELGVGIESIHH